MTVKAIIFDFGEVLLQTGAKNLYRKVFAEQGKSEQEMEYFLKNVFTGAHRSLANSGGTMHAVLEEVAAQNPEWKNEIMAFDADRRFIEQVKGPVPGMPQALVDLKSQGILLFGLTNWAKDTFPKVREAFDFVNIMDDILVSGEAGVKKPNPAVFQMAIKRFGVDPAVTMFFDDKQANVDAARNEGLLAYQFTDVARFKENLAQHGLNISRNNSILPLSPALP